MGIITDSDVINKNYKMLYKASITDKTIIEYIVDVYEEEFNELLIEDYLNNRSNKRSILKTILVEKKVPCQNNDTTNNTTQEFINFNGKYYLNKKIKIIFIDKTFYFIYEDDPSDNNYYEYNVIKMTKDSSNKDGFIKDLITKLNYFQHTFTLTNFYSDKDAIYFFMIMPIIETPNTSSLDI